MRPVAGDGDSIDQIGSVVPVPLSATVCELPDALSLRLKLAERDPVAVGVNVTLIVKLAPALTELPQVLV